MTQSTCSVYIAVSVDGFIAKPDGDIDWLHNPAYALDGEDMGYHAFMESVDALVMGRNSYEKVLGFDIDWPYAKPVIVLTTRPIDIPAELSNRVIPMSGTPRSIIEQAAAQGFHHLYIDGGITIQRFLATGFINQLILTTIPILLGSGIPLFGSFGRELTLALVHSQSYPNGFVQSTYSLQHASKISHAIPTSSVQRR